VTGKEKTDQFLARFDRHVTVFQGGRVGRSVVVPFPKRDASGEFCEAFGILGSRVRNVSVKRSMTCNYLTRNRFSVVSNQIKLNY